MLTPIIYINSHYQTNKIYVIENKATTWIENIKKKSSKIPKFIFARWKENKSKGVFWDLFTFKVKIILHFIILFTMLTCF